MNNPELTSLQHEISNLGSSDHDAQADAVRTLRQEMYQLIMAEIQTSKIWDYDV